MALLQHLILAGPATAAIADDPEAAAVVREMDLDENGAMVDALQRRADIVVQKSLAVGFGLTVAKAMWKRRHVIGEAARDRVHDRFLAANRLAEYAKLLAALDPESEP
jgi:hypothetical protein